MLREKKTKQNNTSIYQKNRKTQQCHRTGKGQFSFQFHRRVRPRMFQQLHICNNFTCQQSNIQILQARLQQYMNHDFPYIQAGFRNGRGTRDQFGLSIGSSKKQKSSRKTSISALLTMPKPLTVWITTNCGKFLKKWKYQTMLPAS